MTDFVITGENLMKIIKKSPDKILSFYYLIKVDPKYVMYLFEQGCDIIHYNWTDDKEIKKDHRRLTLIHHPESFFRIVGVINKKVADHYYSINKDWAQFIDCFNEETGKPQRYIEFL